VLAILRNRGGENFEALVADASKAAGIGLKRVRAVVRDYSNESLPTSPKWWITRVPMNNAVRIRLTPSAL
jgi:hypothetical protein